MSLFYIILFILGAIVGRLLLPAVLLFLIGRLDDRLHVRH